MSDESKSEKRIVFGSGKANPPPEPKDEPATEQDQEKPPPARIVLSVPSTAPMTVAESEPCGETTITSIAETRTLADELIKAPFPSQRSYYWSPNASPGSVTKSDISLVVSQEVLLAVNRCVAEDTSVEIGGFLLGNRYRCPNTGQNYTMIDQYSPAQFTHQTESSLNFTTDAWGKLHDEIHGKFYGKLLVGWYHSHPDIGIFLSGWDVDIHERRFGDEWMSALVIDPVTQKAGFFAPANGKVDPRVPVGFYEYIDSMPPDVRDSVMGWSDYTCLDPVSMKPAYPAIQGKSQLRAIARKGDVEGQSTQARQEKLGENSPDKPNRVEETPADDRRGVSVSGAPQPQETPLDPARPAENFAKAFLAQQRAHVVLPVWAYCVMGFVLVVGVAALIKLPERLISPGPKSRDPALINSISNGTGGTLPATDSTVSASKGFVVNGASASLANPRKLADGLGFTIDVASFADNKALPSVKLDDNPEQLVHADPQSPNSQLRFVINSPEVVSKLRTLRQDRVTNVTFHLVVFAPNSRDKIYDSPIPLLKAAVAHAVDTDAGLNTAVGRGAAPVQPAAQIVRVPRNSNAAQNIFRDLNLKKGAAKMLSKEAKADIKTIEERIDNDANSSDACGEKAYQLAKAFRADVRKNAINNVELSELIEEFTDDRISQFRGEGKIDLKSDFTAYFSKMSRQLDELPQ